MEVKNTKICRTCKEDLNIELFEFRNDTKKYRTECRICQSKRKGSISKIISNREYFEFILSNKKRCSKCKNILNLDKFHIDKNTRSGYTSRCKDCIKEIQSNKKKEFKNRVLINRYGISLDEFNQMIEVQENRCKICKNILNNPFVDHCHKSGKVRGLLCNNCNTGLGMFQDNIEYLKDAINYLIS